MDQDHNAVTADGLNASSNVADLPNLLNNTSWTSEEADPDLSVKLSDLYGDALIHDIVMEGTFFTSVYVKVINTTGDVVFEDSFTPGTIKNKGFIGQSGSTIEFSFTSASNKVVTVNSLEIRICEELGMTTQPSTTQPSTTQPSTTQPSTTQPSTTQPSTTQPSTTQPSTTQPSTTQPSTTQPSTTQPSTTQPSTTQPSTTQPSTTQPSTTQPSTTQPSTTQPSTTQPSTTQPSTTQPSTTQPSTTQPSTTQPSTTQPSTTQPSTTQPSTTQPSTTQPSTTQPSTTQPSTTQPSTTAPVCESVDVMNSDYPNQPYFDSGISGDQSLVNSYDDNLATSWSPPTGSSSAVITAQFTTSAEITSIVVVADNVQKYNLRIENDGSVAKIINNDRTGSFNFETNPVDGSSVRIEFIPAAGLDYSDIKVYEVILEACAPVPACVSQDVMDAVFPVSPSLTASSNQAVIDNVNDNSASVWSPESSDINPWIKATFPSNVDITSVDVSAIRVKEFTLQIYNDQNQLVGEYLSVSGKFYFEADPVSGNKVVIRFDPTDLSSPLSVDSLVIRACSQGTTIQPSTTQPSTTQPSTTQPSTTQPSTTQPSTTQPSTTQPSTTQPSTTQPSTTQPSTTQPSTTQPSTTQPSTTQPSTTQPSTTQPSTTQPSTTQPSTTQPSTTQPSTTQPSTTQPSTTQPSTTQPSTTQPSTTQPSTTQPSTTQPSTTQPSTTQPSTTAPVCESKDVMNSDYPNQPYFDSGISGDQSLVNSYDDDPATSWSPPTGISSAVITAQFTTSADITSIVVMADNVQKYNIRIENYGSVVKTINDDTTGSFNFETNPVNGSSVRIEFIPAVGLDYSDIEVYEVRLEACTPVPACVSQDVMGAVFPVSPSLTASSNQAVIDNVNGNSASVWSPESSDINPWVKATFPSNVDITSVDVSAIRVKDFTLQVYNDQNDLVGEYVSVSGKFYFEADPLSGNKVVIRFDPTDLSSPLSVDSLVIRACSQVTLPPGCIISESEYLSELGRPLPSPITSAIGYIENNGVQGFQPTDTDESVHLNETMDVGVTFLLFDDCNYCTCTDSGDLSCTHDQCRHDCTWLEWSSWTDCTEICDGGTRTRTRDFEGAYNGGAPCDQTIGSSETENCNTEQCPDNCGWSVWQEWTPCTKTCGGGTRIRNRACDNPAPTYDCECPESSHETESCNTNQCPDNECEQNKVWMECDNDTVPHCPLTCQDLSETDSCIDPDTACVPACRCPEGTYEDQSGQCVISENCECYINGQVYPPDYREEDECEIRECEDAVFKVTDKDCAVDCGWSEWTPWLACSKTCGGGQEFRNRFDFQPPASNGGAPCVGSNEESRPCNEEPCPVCMDSYGNVYQETETFNETECEYCECDTNLDIVCHQKADAVVHGSWAPWTQWSACSATCGEGTRTRLRTCTGRMPRCGGMPCAGDMAQGESCVVDICTTQSTTVTTATTSYACDDPNEEYVVACETTCQDVSQAQAPCNGTYHYLDCHCKESYARNGSGSCVPYADCLYCYDHENNRPYPPAWNDANDPCIHYYCNNSNIVMINETEECEVPEGYELTAPTASSCCNFRPIPTVPPETPCSLTSVTKKLEVRDSTGRLCVTPNPIVMTRCAGACNSYDTSNVVFEDDGFKPGTEKDCKCCSGSGDYVPYSVYCGGETTPRTVKLLHFTECSCMSCEGELKPSSDEPQCEESDIDYRSVRDDPSITIQCSGSTSTANFTECQYAWYGSDSMFRTDNTELDFSATMTPAVGKELRVKFVEFMVSDVDNGASVEVLLYNGATLVDRKDTTLPAQGSVSEEFAGSNAVTRVVIKVSGSQAPVSLADLKLEGSTCPVSGEPSPEK